MGSRALGAFVAATVISLAACDDGGGPEGPSGNLEYYCASWSAAFCPAFLECDPFSFPEAFRSMEECLEQTAADCLDPPTGVEPCRGATEEETDACVAYIASNLPDGCRNLFGRDADLSPCEAICEEE